MIEVYLILTVPGCNISCSKSTSDCEPQQQHPWILAGTLHSSALEITCIFQTQSPNQKLDLPANMQLHGAAAPRHARVSRSLRKLHPRCKQQRN